MNKQFTINQVVPHAGPMSLLAKVEDYGDDWLKASANITSDNLFLTDNSVPAWVGIEYMAQAIAAHAGVQSLLNGGEVKVGFLVGTRKYTTNASHFDLGSKLNITVKQMILGENGLGAFDCILESESPNGSIIEARANLNVFQPDNIDEILVSS